MSASQDRRELCVAWGFAVVASIGILAWLVSVAHS